MKILIVSTRIPSPYYGEDRLLMLLAQILAKYGNEVYLYILSKNVVLKLEKSGKVRIDAMLPKHMDFAIIHHDTSFVRYSLIYRIMYRKPVMGLIYFIDKYAPATLIKNIVGWFISQGLAHLITFSRRVYLELRRLGIRRVSYLPLTFVYYRKYLGAVSKHRRVDEAIHVCYIGVVDTERVNIKEIIRLVYELYKRLNRPIKVCIATRPDQRVREVDKYIRPWLRIAVVKRFLSDDEKQELLCRCHIAVFTAKRIRFVVPPLFVVEARSCGCLVYAPHLADVLREEGLDSVYSSIDGLINALRKRFGV